MKERIKSILFVFALALVFVGAAKVTEAAAAVDKYINYAEEKIEVAAVSGATYYQVVKADSVNAVKDNAWIKAAKDETNAARPYVIDISALANNKDSFVAVAGAPDAEEATEVFTVKALVKSMKVALNYKVESVTNGLYEVISKVDVTPVEGEKFDETTNISQKVTLGWKRGANGEWKAADDFNTTEWQMMKNSNTTLYLRAEKLGEDETRFSKEVKVKVPKTAKAPSVKVDFKKGTVSIKNGMEFRLAGSNGAWITVAPKAKSSEEAPEAFFNQAKTSTSKSALTMAELKEVLGSGYKAGEALNLEVRTSATDKKFMSYTALVKIEATPVAALEISTLNLSAAIAVSGTAVTVDLKGLYAAIAPAEGETYEFALTGDGANADTISKYTELKNEVYTYRTNTKGTSYKKTGETKSTSVLCKDATTIYVRKAAQKNGSKQVGFSGEVFSFTIGAKKAN